MKITTKIVLCLAFCILLGSSATAQNKAKSFLTEGTFSNITAGEGGDYGGIQIHLTDSDGQFYVLVTIAEGVKLPPRLIKAKVDIDARKVDFTIPGEGGGRKFTGVVTAEGMSLFEITTKTSSDGLKLSENQERFLKRICQK